MSNIILIGMPGAGKSTVGVLLAKQTARDFIDTDVLIQTKCDCRLQDIVDAQGHLALRRVEEGVLLELKAANAVIATGGSAVYSDVGMQHLQRQGIIVYLDVTLATIQHRVHDFGQRGIARRPDQSLEDLFAERGRLYRRYAQVTIDCNDRTMEAIVAEIVRQIELATQG